MRGFLNGSTRLYQDCFPGKTSTSNSRLSPSALAQHSKNEQTAESKSSRLLASNGIIKRDSSLENDLYIAQTAVEQDDYTLSQLGVESGLSNRIRLLQIQQGAIIGNQRAVSSSDGSTSLLTRANSPGDALDRPVLGNESRKLIASTEQSVNDQIRQFRPGFTPVFTPPDYGLPSPPPSPPFDSSPNPDPELEVAQALNIRIASGIFLSPSYFSIMTTLQVNFTTDTGHGLVAAIQERMASVWLSFSILPWSVIKSAYGNLWKHSNY